MWNIILNKKKCFIGILLLMFLQVATMEAQERDIYAKWRTSWMQKAEELKPVLINTVHRPVCVVKSVKDSSSYQGWRMERFDEMEKVYNTSFKSLKTITVDFGKHLTGYYSFRLKTLKKTQDAPIRLKFTFGEMPSELNTPFDPWKGKLSRAWMQDEIVTITDIEQVITLPRRVAFQYLKIELLAASSGFDFGFCDMYFTATSSVKEVKTELAETTSQKIRDINNVAIETLRECMQTVYEDGPKRDRRLWVGDLYLESLANRYTFQNYSLTKRCLYLFAGLSTNDGIVVANCFEEPYPHPQKGSYCLTYCLLFNSTLLEYLKDTQDYETANELWCVAKRQIEDALTYLGEDYIFDRSNRNVWLFFDWRDGLDVNTPIQGATIFALKQTYELAKMLGKNKEVFEWPHIISKMENAAREKLFDRKKGVFVSGTANQISCLSQVWLILADVLPQKEAQKALRTVLTLSESVMPGTPYATHYLVEAMIKSGMQQEARKYVEEYWGGMIKKGANTFWEAYDPEDDFISPYNFCPLNSYCHAWSCTPTYFIHKYPEIFQK